MLRHAGAEIPVVRGEAEQQHERQADGGEAAERAACPASPQPPPMRSEDTGQIRSGMTGWGRGPEARRAEGEILQAAARKQDAHQRVCERREMRGARQLYHDPLTPGGTPSA